MRALVLIFECTAVWTESCDVTILHVKIETSLVVLSLSVEFL